MRILLVDGFSILSRAFYGIPALSNSRGVPTNAVLGFFNITLKVIKEQKIDSMACFFDLKSPTFRHQLYKEYKGTRKPMPEDLHIQADLLKEILKIMGIAVITWEGYEADDLIGSASLLSREKGYDTVILSGDRDLLQLSEDNIKICLPRTVKKETVISEYFPEDVFEEWGVTPEEFIDLKALMGDTSDNIPGAPGLGGKSSEWIIKKYHTVENAYQAALSKDPDFKVPRKPKAPEIIINEWDKISLSKTLATIERHVPLEMDFNTPVSGMFNKEAFKYIRDLELKSLFKYFRTENSEDLKRTGSQKFMNLNVSEKANNNENPNGADNQESLKDPGDMEDGFIPEYESLPSGEELLKLIEGKKRLGFYLSDRLYIDTGDRHLMTDDYQAIFLSLTKRDIKLFTIGLKDQLKADFLERAENIYDIEAMAYLLDPTRGERSLEDLFMEFSDLDFPKAGPMPSAYGIMPSDDSASKIITDHGNSSIGALTATVSLKISEEAEKRLEEKGLMWLFKNVDMPLVYTLYHMEREGILIDRDELELFGRELSEEEKILTEEIYKETGEFNINSPKQLGEVLFGHLGLKGGKKTKTGYSTSADVLEKLAPENPVVEKILRYRTIRKLNSTYAEGLKACISEDKRIHGEFSQFSTATGRLSSSNPNLQNIPVRTAEGRRFRKMFIPREGWIFVDSDYSQVELRILAFLSADEKLINAYKNAADIHTVTASQVFGIPEKEVTKELRTRAKAVNFGIVYGISAFGLSEGLMISPKEASAYIERYFKTYPGVKAFLDRTVEEAREQSYSETCYGRIRPIPDIRSQNFQRRSFSERVAMNSPIQGSAADIMRIAMNNVDIRLRKEGLSGRIVLQVHDELLVECPAKEEEKVREILKSEMENASDLVSLICEVNSGRNWEDAH